MEERLIFCAGSTKASRYAATYLKAMGLPVVDSPTEKAGHLLLDVPSFGPDGQLRGGGAVEELLTKIPKDTIVYGGNLNHPSLKDYRTVDFLRDAIYLAGNSYITAECALDVALPYLTITLRNCPTLIIGWGRIGKCLGHLLKSIGADVTIAARKGADRAMIHALGFHAVNTSHLDDTLSHYRLIFNTVPELVLNQKQMTACHPDCIKIELASKDGMQDEDVIVARGLPGVHMPESSGKLIAETFIRLYEKEDAQ